MKSRIRPELRPSESPMSASEEENRIIPSEIYAELNLVLKLMEEKENFRLEIDNPTELDLELCQLLASKVSDHKPASVALLARIILLAFGNEIGRAMPDALKIEMAMDIVESFPKQVDMLKWFNRLASTKTPSGDVISLAELEAKLDAKMEEIERLNADFDGDDVPQRAYGQLPPMSPKVFMGYESGKLAAYLGTMKSVPVAVSPLNTLRDPNASEEEKMEARKQLISGADKELSEEDKACLARTEEIARKLGLCVPEVEARGVIPEDRSDVYSSPSQNSYLDKDDNDE